MVDENDKKVVSLADRRQRAEQEAHERGEMFEFTVIDEPDLAVGTVEDGVVLRFEPDGLKGYMMTRENARKLAISLIEAAGFLDLTDNDMIKDPE